MRKQVCENCMRMVLMRGGEEMKELGCNLESLSGFRIITNKKKQRSGIQSKRANGRLENHAPTQEGVAVGRTMGRNKSGRDGTSRTANDKRSVEGTWSSSLK